MNKRENDIIDRIGTIFIKQEDINEQILPDWFGRSHHCTAYIPAKKA